MKCPLCDGDLSTDTLHKWILCNSNNHKYKLTDFDDDMRKTVTLKQLSDSVMGLKDLIKNTNPEDKINIALLNGQMHAYQMLADYLRDDDWRDYESLNPSKVNDDNGK